MASTQTSKFQTLFDAAHLAKKHGETALAMELDVLARKENAAISNRRNPGLLSNTSVHLTWKDVPSVFPEGEQHG